MSQIGSSSLSSSQINQAGGVLSQNQVGNAGSKIVQENRSQTFDELKVSQQSRRNFLENHGTLKRPTSGGSTRPTFASFRKSTTSTQATPQSQSAEMSKTPRASFASIKEQRSLGGERGQAMIGKNRSMPQAQAQTEVTQQSSGVETPKTPQRMFGLLNLHNTEQERISRNRSSSSFKFSIGQQREVNDKNIANGVRYYKKYHSISDEKKAQLLTKLAIVSGGGDYQVTAGLFKNYSTEALEKLLDFARLNTRLSFTELKTKYELISEPVQPKKEQLNSMKNELSKIDVANCKQETINKLSNDQKKFFDKLSNRIRYSSGRLDSPRAFVICCSVIGDNNDPKALKKFFKELEGLAKRDQLFAGSSSRMINVDAFMELIGKYSINLDETKIKNFLN